MLSQSLQLLLVAFVFTQIPLQKFFPYANKGFYLSDGVGVGFIDRNSLHLHRKFMQNTTDCI